MDRINIKNLEVFAYHGVFPAEKKHGQVFVISASIYTYLSMAGKTHDLTKTLNYAKICHDIKSFVIGHRFELIETVAERLAEKLLIDYPKMQKIWIEIKKPNAPIDLRLETVSVEIERSRHTAFIGLGSNLGDREEYLRFAVRELKKDRSCRVLEVSSFESTPPYGVEEQGDFLNGCVKLETLLFEYELLDLCQTIENKAGRIRDKRWGPRTLDLDIIMYDDLVMSNDRLTLPHIEMHKRDFVLKPLTEIAPYLIHPVYRKSVSQLYSELEMS